MFQNLYSLINARHTACMCICVHVYFQEKKIHLFTYYLETFKDHLLGALYVCIQN